MEMKFAMSAAVRIEVSGEEGKVIARAEYENQSEPQYLVRYRAADGRAVESWWSEGALVTA